MPDAWRIETVQDRCQNDHDDYCNGPQYDYDLPLNIEKPTKSGIPLADLDSKGTSKRNQFIGACSQEHVIVKFFTNKRVIDFF